MFENCFDLLAGYAGKPSKKIIDASPAFKVLEKSYHRDACSTKHPSTAYLVRITLDDGTIGPVQHDGETIAIVPNEQPNLKSLRPFLFACLELACGSIPALLESCGEGEGCARS